MMYLVVDKTFPHEGGKIQLRDDQIQYFVRTTTEEDPGFWERNALYHKVDPASFLEVSDIEVARQVWAEVPPSSYYKEYKEYKNKIHAIKDLRGRLNIGLKEAKDFIDQVESEESKS